MRRIMTPRSSLAPRSMTWEGNYDINQIFQVQVIYRVCQFIHKTLKIVFSRWHAIAPHIWSLRLSFFAVKVAWGQMKSPCVGKYQLSPLPGEKAKAKTFLRYRVIVPRALIICASSTCFSTGNKSLFFLHPSPNFSLYHLWQDAEEWRIQSFCPVLHRSVESPEGQQSLSENRRWWGPQFSQIQNNWNVEMKL